MKVKTKPETAPVLNTNLTTQRPTSVTVTPTQQIHPPYASMTIPQQIQTLRHQLQVISN